MSDVEKAVEYTEALAREVNARGLDNSTRLATWIQADATEDMLLALVTLVLNDMNDLYGVDFVDETDPNKIMIIMVKIANILEFYHERADS